jgi:hypothetical protein
MRFYLHKIGGHLQELAILAMVFVPLDRGVTARKMIVLWGICGTILMVGIEMERRA